MASVENIPTVNNESEMEEGEIVDDLDDLSDISSEEEFLLRQRLQVLESYNNVLERKKAKRASILSGKDEHKTEMILHDLSEISATELDDSSRLDKYKCHKDQSYKKLSHRDKKIGLPSSYKRSKEHKKRSHRKRRLEVKIISESSEESDDEYKDKRQKLAEAVTLNKAKSDTSTLKTRLEKMLYGAKKEDCANIAKKAFNRLKNEEESNGGIEGVVDNNVESIQEINVESKNDVIYVEGQCQKNRTIAGCKNNEQEEQIPVSYELIDLSSEDTSNLELKGNDVVDSNNKENVEAKDITNKDKKEDSDDDLEILRQHALKTKNFKSKFHEMKKSIGKSKTLSEEDDSDTSELRLICLKSALLKKAIEMKLKQKFRKRLKSKTMSLQDDLMFDQEELRTGSDVDNNTDIESVDMDIGSDGDDKVKESSGNPGVNLQQKSTNSNSINSNIPKSNKDDELEEDEDLLRAKLLTSLSKNLPNLVHMDIIHTIDNDDKTDDINKTKQAASEEKKFIINLQDSDSEVEHEATKNLTKMHMKLSEQEDFQQKLDLFLKTTRMQVENSLLPDVVQQPPVPKPHNKYVAKAVNHLPRSEQIEYKNLVKRMAELEKIKHARQISMNTQSSSSVLKDTLKPRNVSVHSKNPFPTSNLEEKIAVSRKNIAEESAKMLRLKEEATKLSQKYKIVATELRNISTAITLNKKEQRTVQSKLSRIRVQHQILLKSSNFKHSTGSPPVNQANNKSVVSSLQKENNPTKEVHKIPTMLKAVTVSVVNNLSKVNSEPSSQISVQVDVNSNKKFVKLPKNLEKERIVSVVEEKLETSEGKADVTSKEPVTCDKKDTNHPVKEKVASLIGCGNNDRNDYQSPLQVFGSTTWTEDPNAVLCPYEVAGSCRDPGCKFLHPKLPSRQ
ncbi:unnamed protein product, partial [Iphiclides podalirius]